MDPKEPKEPMDESKEPKEPMDESKEPKEPMDESKEPKIRKRRSVSKTLTPAQTKRVAVIFEALEHANIDTNNQDDQIAVRYALRSLGGK